MKLLALIIMLIALYLLYRIAYPKQCDTKGKDIGFPEKKAKATQSVMGKSRFVLPDRSQSQPTTSTILETEKQPKKDSIFATETEEKQSAIIPVEQLDKVFEDESNSEIFSLPLEYEKENEVEDEIDFEAEEAEEIRQALGQEIMLADGIDYDDLQNFVTVVKEQPDEVSEKTAETLVALENTDMFELLISRDESRMLWIKSVVERNIQNKQPETENIADTDYGDFEVKDFLESV